MFVLLVVSFLSFIHSMIWTIAFALRYMFDDFVFAGMVLLGLWTGYMHGMCGYARAGQYQVASSSKLHFLMWL
jgi:hypothetical protein